jgi:hypothetical protein
MLTDDQLAALIASEENGAVTYHSQIAKNRTRLMDYYNQLPYGDEVDGQSQIVTSDVADTIEWMLPGLLRIFTQGSKIAKFESTASEYDDEAMEKEALANHIFLKENDGVLILHNMMKDALMQYSGTVKVYAEEYQDTKTNAYEGLSRDELTALEMTAGVEVEDVEEVENEEGEARFNAKKVKRVERIRYVVENIPPEEFLFNESARDFKNLPFIGHRSPKTRSQLKQMGFDAEVVDSLPADSYFDHTEEKNARHHNSTRTGDNPSNHHPNDTIYLGEYYYEVDVNEDGITELYKIFYAGAKVLDKEECDEHPFGVIVPIPMPHKALGTCPAEQAADIQLRNTTLMRQMLDNIYQTNYPRIAHSDKVDIDDLLTPRPGGTVEVDTENADVAGHIQSIAVQPLIEPMLLALEKTDSQREIRTGVSRFSQGLDPESLNKTATGFQGIREDGAQRLELIARLFADTGIKDIFRKIINVVAKHQSDALHISVMGKELDINPVEWQDETRVSVNVGLGSGDRKEKIVNLNYLLQKQEQYLAAKLPIVDQAKIYKTLERLVHEVGLKDVEDYFNDPNKPEEVLLAMNEQLIGQVMELQAALQQRNPLAEAEMVKVQGDLARESGKSRLKLIENESKKDAQVTEFLLKLAQEDAHFRQKLMAQLTELELKYEKDVPGASV